VREDRVLIDDAREITYSYCEHPGYALIVAVTSDNRIPVLRHFRLPVRDWVLEFPSGRIDLEDPLAAARRELHEEAGGTSDDWSELGSLYPSAGSSSEVAHLFLARNVKIGTPGPELDESFELLLPTVDEVASMIDRGMMKDAVSIVAFTRARRSMTAGAQAR
jgi:ADP-ribose pyrophosphatase